MKKSIIRNRLFKKQQGFTILEVMIAITILLVIIGMSTGVFVSTTQNQAQIRSESTMRSAAQTSLFRLTGKMNQTRMIMGNDALGNAYKNNLNLTAAPAPLPSPQLALPTIRSDGSLSPEKTCDEFPSSFFRSNAVGNTLLFSRYMGKFSNFPIADVALRRALDTYEFKYIYITSAPGNSRRWFLDSWYNSSPSMPKLRLVEWTSVKYVDYEQFNDYINESTAANRTIIRNSLTAAGINYAWRRNGANYTGGSADIFYNVTGAGATVSTIGGHTIPQRGYVNFMNFDNDNYSLAYNQQPNKAQAKFFPIRNKVPLYYDPNPPACSGALPAPGTTPALSTGFPYGFEVMVIGPASGRTIMLRVTNVALISSKRLIDQANTITAYARDL